MIRFINDQPPRWEELRALGLRPEITSQADFEKAFGDGWKEALKFVRDNPRKMAPDVRDLKLTHEFLFSTILNAPGEFRHDAKINQLLANTPERAQDLLLQTDRGKQFGIIARCHAELMREGPFADCPGRPFINRSVAAVVLEAQLEHWFGHGIRREIDVSRLEKALRENASGMGSKVLETIVREMASRDANLYQFERWRRRDHGHGHDH